MNRSVHEQARELVALAGVDALSSDQRNWLRNHLTECGSCSDFAEAVRGAVSVLRSEPQAADFALVQATQKRVRARALELQHQNHRIRAVWAACVLVGLFAAITTPLFWLACEWMGQRAGIASWLWKAGFGFIWIVPALVVSVLFLAHGTHLANDEKHEF